MRKPLMAKFRIKKNNFNKYLPKKAHYSQDISVYYDPKFLNFGCNQCGKCCDLKKTHRVDDNLVVYLTDLDIKKLQKHKIESSINNRYPNIDNLAYFARTGILRKSGEKVARIEKQDGACPFFDDKTNKCLIYSSRPIICRVYPFVAGQVDKHSLLHLEISIDNEKLLCDPECFQTSTKPLTITDLGKIVIYHVILHNRKDLGRKYANKITNEFITVQKNDPTIQSLVGTYLPFFNQIFKGAPDSKDEYYVQCQNDDLIFFKTWIYCNQDAEILSKIQTLCDENKEYNQKNPPRKSSEIISSGLPVTVAENIFQRKNEIKGIMIMLRIPPAIYAKGFENFTAQEFHQLKQKKNSNESFPLIVKQYRDIMKFVTVTIDLDN